MAESKRKQKELMDAEEATRVLTQERQERVQQCQKDIQKALDVHRCTLSASVQLRQGIKDPMFRVEVIPLP